MDYPPVLSQVFKIRRIVSNAQLIFLNAVALSLGLSGFGLSHSDIGGYTTLNGILTRSEELLLRWAEYSVFTPLMRTHEGAILIGKYVSKITTIFI
jgi:hypothetical protein